MFCFTTAARGARSFLSPQRRGAPDVLFHHSGAGRQLFCFTTAARGFRISLFHHRGGGILVIPCLPPALLSLPCSLIISWCFLDPNTHDGTLSILHFFGGHGMRGREAHSNTPSLSPPPLAFPSFRCLDFPESPSPSFTTPSIPFFLTYIRVADNTQLKCCTVITDFCVFS